MPRDFSYDNRRNVNEGKKKKRIAVRDDGIPLENASTQIFASRNDHSRKSQRRSFLRALSSVSCCASARQSEELSSVGIRTPTIETRSRKAVDAGRKQKRGLERSPENRSGAIARADDGDDARRPSPSKDVPLRYAPTRLQAPRARSSFRSRRLARVRSGAAL